MVEESQRRTILEWWERRCQLRREIAKMQVEYRAMGTLPTLAANLGLTYQSLYNVIRYQIKKVKPWSDTTHLRLFRDRV